MLGFAIPFILISGMIIDNYFSNQQNRKREAAMAKHGRYVVAVVTRVYMKDIGYTYSLSKKKGYNRFYAKKGQNFMYRYDLGDTIIVLLNPYDLLFSRPCHDLPYKSCYGPQPVRGWKEKPACK